MKGFEQLEALENEWNATSRNTNYTDWLADKCVALQAELAALRKVAEAAEPVVEIINHDPRLRLFPTLITAMVKLLVTINEAHAAGYLKVDSNG